MSYYYKYKFCSPEPIFALIKEELRSYFNTGAIDDTLFPVYTEKCLKKLGRGSYKINEILLDIQDFRAALPVDFIAVREAWLCTKIDHSFQAASADYSQSTTSTRIDTPDVYCDPCSECENPNIIRAIYKTTHTVAFHTTKKFLLRPGNITVKDHCAVDCANFGSSESDSFDIRDNKFTVNFRDGVVYLVYYTEEKDSNGYQLIPDNIRIHEYIESYIKYKMFCLLSNQVIDETANQIAQKKAESNAEQYEKQVLAEIEIKKQTVDEKHRATLRTMHRNRKYEIK